MKKRLIAFFMAGASTAAFSDVNLYGRVAVGLENDNFQNTTVPGSTNIQDFGSYFGIRGTDPVYGETSAIWQVEQFLDIASGQAYYSTTAGGAIVPQTPGSVTANNGHVNSETNTLASSESYLGLQGAWGRLRLGNLSNYMRSSMGAIDTFNYNNGVNGLGTWSRSSRLLPTSIRYDSPTWGGFNFSGEYSYQTDGAIGVSGVGSTNNFGGGLNGVYSAGVISGGVAWKNSNYSVKLGTMITQEVGAYSNGTSGLYMPAGSQAAYPNAYINRLEFGYDDPEGMIIGAGLQVSNGQGWFSWANSGGSMNNYIYNPGYNVQGLNTNQYQTQELSASFGWHLGPWTPKIAYVYGGNMMYGGNMLSIATGAASQIANSGYQQAVAELDWNITPKTIVFINAGQVWWGSTMQNVSYCGLNCATTKQGTPVNGSNQAFLNQSSTAIGFTHTF
jgi:predicted porin